ncbi:MAG: hypothetical protein IKR05_04050 [Prevotella sp.]|nr:hypothetical protein [Prevotella sp.]
MAYNSRHSIFLHNNNKQKLLFLKSLLDEEDLFFVLQEETVYQYDGEPLTVPCISDINWNYGDGYVWHDFETDMERVSEKFNRQYPDDVISIYVKTEDGFENLYEFHDGGVRNTDIIHYQAELNKVCEELNQNAPEASLPLYEVIDIADHPTVLFHYGAYTFIGYNIFEIYSECCQYFKTEIPIGSPIRNYDHTPFRIKALQILYNNLLERRKTGNLRP